MDLKELWYAKLNFKKNPLSIKPAIINDKLIGQAETLDATQDVLKKGGMCVIIGEYGVGKTTFLKSVIRRYSGKRKVVYFSCNRLLGPLNLDKMIHERFGIVGRLLKIKSRDMILLLDEADNMSKEDFKAAYKYMKQGFFKSIVYVTHDMNVFDSPKDVMNHIGEKVYDISMISKDDAVTMIRNRIGDLSIISDKVIGDIFEMSEGRPRTLLKNCEDVCRNVVDNGHKRATKRNINDAIARYV